MPVQVSALRSAAPVFAEPFLRIPPFPSARVQSLIATSNDASTGAELVDILRQARVGGTYWAAQPDLPSRYILARSVKAADSAAVRWSGEPIVLWTEQGPPLVAQGQRLIVTGECDPWHVLSGAAAFIDDGDDDLRLVAALLGVDTFGLGADGVLAKLELDVQLLVAGAVSSATYANPFTNQAMSARDAVELCGFWRRLIDSNRGIAGGLGFAFWKRDNVAPLLWDGAGPFSFFGSADEIESAERVAIWRSKSPSQSLADLEERGVSLVEVEDGFLRSHGLGADCVPPLSITVDVLGAYFDPSSPSELENLLQNGVFDDGILERARLLRRTIVASGLSKYGRDEGGVDRRVEGRRHILVPGQVEDDRSVQTGGCGLSTNIQLLQRVREQAPDAYILYKAHPDVVAGHRKGAIPDRVCRQYADEIVGDEPITSLIAMVDEVHVNTSLAGFEALMREKPVTTYGVPFYAGWGLTTDLGPVPARRTAKRDLDELVAATLLLYPRYLDPATGLPCPPEVVVARLCEDDGRDAGLVVSARRLQGKIMRSVRSLVS